MSKAEKKFSTKESFQCLFIPVILIDSVYRKDENYYPKVFLEKFIHNFVWRNITNFNFWGFGSSSSNIRSFLSLGQESSISRNINFCGVVLLYFSS